jgi:hypothetical protein
MGIKESLGFVAIQISNLNSKRFLFCSLLEYILYLLIMANRITGEFGVATMLGVGAFWISKDTDRPTSQYSPGNNGELKDVNQLNKVNGDI